MIRDKKHARRLLIEYFYGDETPLMDESYKRSRFSRLFWRLFEPNYSYDESLKEFEERMEESFKNFDMPCVLGEIAENEVDEDDSERAKWLVKEANSNLYMVLALDDFLYEDEEYTKERGLNLKLFDIFEIIGKAQYKCNRELLSEGLKDIIAEIESGKK